MRTARANDYVDGGLSYAQVQQRVADPAVAPHLQGQMVLWQGVVAAQTPLDDKHVELLLVVGNQGTLHVRYLSKCPTLQCDRTGYRVAAKGHIHLQDGQFDRSGRCVPHFAGAVLAVTGSRRSRNVCRPPPPPWPASLPGDSGSITRTTPLSRL